MYATPSEKTDVDGDPLSIPRSICLVCIFIVSVFCSGCFLKNNAFTNGMKGQPALAPELDPSIQGTLLTETWLQDFHTALSTPLCPNKAAPTGANHDQCGTAKWDEAMKAYRNSLINAIAAKIDDNYDTFKSRLNSGHSYLALFGDLAVLGLNGAGGIAGDADLKSILSTAAAGVTGGSAAYDKQVLNQQNVLAIISTMDGMRATQMADITAREQNSVADYSIEQGLLDLRALYDDGTLVAALLHIQGSAQKAKDDARTLSNDSLKTKH